MGVLQKTVVLWPSMAESSSTVRLTNTEGTLFQVQFIKLIKGPQGVKQRQEGKTSTELPRAEQEQLIPSKH